MTSAGTVPGAYAFHPSAAGWASPTVNWYSSYPGIVGMTLTATSPMPVYSVPPLTVFFTSNEGSLTELPASISQKQV